MKIFPEIKKNQKHFLIEINRRDIEKLGTNICASMHVTANFKKDVNPLL